MEADSFAGRMSEMRDSPWLASEDLEDPNDSGYIEVAATVASVLEIRDAQFKGGRTKAKGYALKFREFDRMLYLNGVNREKLKEMFGRKATDVIGNAITLYVNPRVKLMGKTVPGIRIKSCDRPPEQPPSLSPEDQAYIEDAKSNIAEASTIGDLESVGEILKGKSQPIRDAVRQAYAVRKKEIEGT